jgi:hypothetical protein
MDRHEAQKRALQGSVDDVARLFWSEFVKGQ